MELKIYIDNVNWDADHAGPNCFAKRLAFQLGRMGYIISDHDNYDVAITFICSSNKLDINKPFIHRLDGIWMSPKQHAAGMNNGIKRTHDMATAVVYQSEFDKSMAERWLGTAKRSSVIRNGIELVPANLRSETLIELRQRYDKVFCSAAQWHPQKRLHDNIELFKHLRATQHPRSCLIVMGNMDGNDVDKMVSDRDIFYTGSIRHDLCAEVYSISDWMIHLAYLDHCPNTVIEAISQGCPVICASEGGTRELVEPNNGIVIADAEKYDFSLVDYDDPPRVPLNNAPQLPEGFRADPSTVDIVRVAERYVDLLESIV